MSFRSVNECFLTAVSILICVFGVCSSIKWNGSYNANGTIFQYQDINQCKRHEFYDLDNFKCIACNSDESSLQPTENRLACECAAGTTTIAFYDSKIERPICDHIKTCSTNSSNPTATTATYHDNCTEIENKNETGTGSESYCELKYVNRTHNDDLEWKQSIIRIIRLKPSNLTSCHCDLKYNFHYHDYCIANQLMKPYLHYNLFWQTDLKFVAFFCLRVHNVTACNHLANLCIKSHYSFDKNSPCSAFLLTQASDVAFKFGINIDEQLRSMRPFLFFKKGKETIEFLSDPMINSTGYILDAKSQINIFSTHYELNGSFKRRGDFHLDHVNLCGAHASEISQQRIIFGKRYKPMLCYLRLASLIDLAETGWRSDFISLFLNYTSPTTNRKKILMHSIPILIENLTPENESKDRSQWLLVKRFQLIKAQQRFHFGLQKPSYEDTQKLQIYRSIRFVTKFELHYEIHDRNRISVPIVRLRYQNIEIHDNTTLDDLFPFSFKIIYATSKKASTSQRHEILIEFVLPLLLLTAVTISLLRAYNHRKRCRSTIFTNSAEIPQPVPIHLCDFHGVLEFLIQLCSNLSQAFLIFILLNIIYDGTEFITQKEIKVTLPLIKDDRKTFEILIYLSLLLKFIFYCIHLWRCTHFDLFFIDWERPRNYDNNHFNLKSNLETSSVCSSVRTFGSENNISAWRILFTANEWIRLSMKERSSFFVQWLALLGAYKFLEFSEIIQDDLILQLYFITFIHIGIYCAQRFFKFILFNHVTGNPIKKFIDLCSWANVSVFILLTPSYGYYIHGRSPHGFADTDMSSMIVQLQRESHSMCGRRGLLNDSDEQAYIILPPINLRTYFQRLLIPFQRSFSISQAHYQKETSSLGAGGGADDNLKRTFSAYSSINRFFCAFIDHAIKDMDYIIKEKTVLERLLDCEFENYLTENKGTFYIDKGNSFSKIFPYNNEHTFVIELLLLLALFLSTHNLILTSALVYFFKLLTHHIVSSWLRRNVSEKTLIDKRFLL